MSVVVDRGADRRTIGERRAVAGPWSGRDRRSGLDRRKGERRLGFGRRAGALTVPRRFPEGGPVAVPRARVVAESGLITVGLAAACMAIGLRLIGEDVVLPYSVGSLASAWSLWHAPAGSELAFGYDEPPLLPLLQVPLAFDTGVTAELVLMPAVSVLVGAALAGIVHAVLAGFRVSFGMRLVATVLIVSNPAWLYFTTTGLPTIGGMLAVVAGFYGLVNWLRFGNLLWILVSSVALALGMLAWYPVTTWAIGALMLLAGVLVARRRPVIELLGILLVYSVPLLFALGLWTLIVWLGTGDVPPWLESAPLGAGIVTSTADFALLLAPVALAVAIALAVYTPRRPDVVGAGVALFLLIPLFIAVLRRVLDPGPNAGAGSLFFVILPTVAIVVTASVFAELAPRLRALVGIALAACVLTGNALLFSWMDDREALPTGDFAALLAGEPVTGTLPPAVRVGDWLEANAVDGEVAVAPGVDERSHQVVALMARMPDLLDSAEQPPRWLVVPDRRPAAGRLRAGVHRGTALGRRPAIRPAYPAHAESSFPLKAIRCETGPNVAPPHRTARSAVRHLGRLLPADQVRARGLQRADDRLGAHGDRRGRAGDRPARRHPRRARRHAPPARLGGPARLHRGRRSRSA